MAGIHGANDIVTDGLVLYVDAANPRSYPTSGSIIYDLGSSKRNGSLVGGVTYSSLNKGVMSFDGSSGYINFGTSAGSFLSPNFSFGAYFYFNNVPQNGFILSKRNDSPYNQYNMGINFNSSNGGNGTKLVSFINPDQSVAPYITFDYELSSFGSGWFYGLITVGTNQQKLYVNGVNVLTTNVNISGKTFIIPNKNFYIGALNVNDLPSFLHKSFYIANVTLYDRTLNESEVSKNFNALRRRYGI